MLDRSFNFLRPYEVDDLIRLGRNEIVLFSKSMSQCLNPLAAPFLQPVYRVIKNA